MKCYFSSLLLPLMLVGGTDRPWNRRHQFQVVSCGRSGAGVYIKHSLRFAPRFVVPEENEMDHQKGVIVYILSFFNI